MICLRQGTPAAHPMSLQTRSRSDKNAAVLGSKEPRQVPAFLYGLTRHRVRCWLMTQCVLCGKHALVVGVLPKVRGGLR